MNLGNIISDSFKYPFSDIGKFLIFCVITIFVSIVSVVGSLGYTGDLIAILSIVSLIFSIFIPGYFLDILKTTMNGESVLPDFDVVGQFIKGIKAVIFKFIYYIIPTILTLLITWATGGFSSGGEIFQALVSSNMTNASSLASVVPASTLTTFGTSMTITALLGVVIFFIFEIFCILGLCRFVKHDSFLEGFNITELWGDINRIGLINVIICFIVLYIIVWIITFISLFLYIIPFIGGILSAILGVGFVQLVMARSVALLYSEQ